MGQKLFTDSNDIFGSISSFHDYVIRCFGHPSIEVELDECDTKMFLIDALEHFSMVRSKLNYSVVNVNQPVDLSVTSVPPGFTPQLLASGCGCDGKSGKVKIVCSPEDSSKFIGIREVMMAEHIYPFLETSFGFPAPFELYLGSFRPDEYITLLGWIETVNKVYSSDFTWHSDGTTIYYDNLPLTAKSLTVEYATMIDFDEFPVQYRHWVKRFVIARSKMKLGEIRGLYSQIPGPGGGITLNGDTLRNEGSSDMTLLLDELRTYRLPDLPIWG